MKKIVQVLSHLFVPQEKNDFRGRSLHVDFLTYYLAFALIFTFALKQIKSGNSVLGFATDITVDKIYQLTNEQRQKNNLPPLAYNKQLAEAATKKAEDMFRRNYWSHYGPDGTTPWSFILDAGYRYEYAGENLAKNFLFSQGVIDGWMQSPSHRENILRPEYTDIGLAIVNGTLNGEETTLVVQTFAKPLNGAAVSEKSAAQVDTHYPQPVRSQVLAQKTSQPKINIAALALRFDLVFFALLFIILIADIYFAARFNVIHLGGKTVAHSIFIGFIILGLAFFLSKGAII